MSHPEYVDDLARTLTNEKNRSSSLQRAAAHLSHVQNGLDDFLDIKQPLGMITYYQQVRMTSEVYFLVLTKFKRVIHEVHL